MNQHMNPKNLLTELAARPLLCDGAMGTQLIAAGLAPGEAGEPLGAVFGRADKLLYAAKDSGRNQVRCA